MNPIKKLTKKTVEGIKEDNNRETFVWDSELKGFGIRVLPSGRKTYIIQYRNQFNRTRRKKIGVHGVITAEQAREQAKIILGEVARGNDPSSNSLNLRNERTVKDLAEKYLELHAKPNKNKHSYTEDKRRIDKVILIHFGHKKISELNSLDLQEMHNDFKIMPYKANRLLALLSKMYSLAIQWGWAEANPTKGISKYKEQPRTRWLKTDELNKLLKALDDYHNQDIANIIRLLLLTGARRNEVLWAEWEQFDLDRAIWTKPAHTTKQNKSEHLPLSSQATGILKEMHKRKSGPFLFPGNKPGQPLQTIKKSWNSIRNHAGLTNIRLHDLRHTHASHLVSSGLSLSIVGKLLGHTQASTTQRYAHLADEPLREAAELFGRKMSMVKPNTEID